MSKARKKILDTVTSYEYAKLFNNKNTKVRLRKSKIFGLEVVCTKPIQKGETIAYYRFKVFREDGFKPYKDSMYNTYLKRDEILKLYKKF